MTATASALVAASAALHAQDVIITGIVDGELPGGLPKAIEIYVAGTVDLEGLTVVREANSPGVDGFIDLEGVYTDEFVYLVGPGLGGADGVQAFADVFGHTGDFANVIFDRAVTGNGDDKFSLVDSGSQTMHTPLVGPVHDAIGNAGSPGDVEDQMPYRDGWLYRKSDTGPDGDFVPTNFTTSGNDALDNTDAAGIAAAVPFGTYVRAPDATNACPPDQDTDGNLDIDDFSSFVTNFFSSNALADVNADQTLDIDDFSDFVSQFFNPPEGCSP
ncbi:MAG: GC-type dockerin domain-anchored protein [Planctomycetota bacterium]